MNEHVMADDQAAAAQPATGPVLYLNAVQRRYQQGEAELKSCAAPSSAAGSASRSR